MENQIKALPAIIRMRAERILKAGAKTAYRLDVSDANLIKVVMLDDKVRYVNLSEGREVKSTELKVTLVDDNQKDLTSRVGVTFTPEQEETIRALSKKKTARKKKTAKASGANQEKKGVTKKTSKKKPD